MNSRIVLPVYYDRVLIFNIDDIKNLRSLGVLGILSGTLPNAPQQNIFLGVPLQLSFNETVWLVEHGHGFLVDSKEYHRISEEPAKESIAINAKSNDFIQIPNSIQPADDLNPMELKEFISRQNYDKSGLKEAAQRYHTFSCIRNKGYFILPGIRFGGELIAYPGDPLRYHSHLIINTAWEGIKLLDLITGGRLATGVKKVWLVMGENTPSTNFNFKDEENQERNPMTFSIEWAGFG